MRDYEPYSDYNSSSNGDYRFEDFDNGYIDPIYIPSYDKDSSGSDGIRTKSVDKSFRKTKLTSRLYLIFLSRLINSLLSVKKVLKYLKFIIPKSTRKEISEIIEETKADLRDIKRSMELDGVSIIYIRFILTLNIVSVIMSFIYQKLKDSILGVFISSTIG